MQFTDFIYTHNMTGQQRAWFYAEYERARKDEAIGVIFAIFLGCFGVHHFYLRRDGLGILYLVFSWTGIPTVLGWIDAFFTPARVRQYNAMQASYISNQILGSVALFSAASPSTAPRCTTCGGPIHMTAAFCPQCGDSTASNDNLHTQPAV